MTDYGFRQDAQRPDPRLPLDQQTAIPIRQVVERVTSVSAPVEHNWIRIFKTVDESVVSDNVLSNDAMLNFTMLPSTNYAIRLRVFYDTVAAADFKWALVGPAAGRIRVLRQWIVPSAAAFAGTLVDTGYTTSQSLLSAGTAGGYIEADIVVAILGAGGTFAFQWAQDTSDVGTTKVLSSSYLEYTIVA